MAIRTPFSDRSPEETSNPGQEEIDALTEKEYSPEDYERRHGHPAANPTDPRGNDTASGDSSDPRSPSREELSKSEDENPRAGGPKESGSYYKKGSSNGKKSLRTRLDGSAALRRYLIFGGMGASIIALIIVIVGFLSVFKLDGLLSNIEQRAFLRHQASLSNRSSKFISAYIEARMMDWGDSPDLNKNENTLFRATRVDTNNPFFDWYKTLRTSGFEQQVFEKHGIKFTSSVGPDGRARPGLIDISGQKPVDVSIPNADLDKIAIGDVSTLNKYQAFFDLQTFQNNKEARKAIKDVVNANTHWWQLYERRFLRKNIQNMTGVTDWRFFETTRDKITNKKIEIRNRILNKMLPDDNLMARIVRCVYGLSTCKPNSDVASPEDRVTTADLEEIANEPAANDTKQSDTESKLALKLDEAGISDALKKVLVSANIFAKIANIPQTLDMLSYINQNVGNLVKLVVVARGAQAAGLFQVFETSRDQIKTGQVSSEEVNAFMENIDNAANSSGWTQVIAADGAAPGTTITGGVCSQDAQALKEKDLQAFYAKYKNSNPQYDPLCADQQIGNASNAQKIQDEYHQTIGQVIGPIVGAWSGFKSIPIIGSIVNALEKLTNWFSGIISSVLEAVLSALGLKDNVQAAIAWVFAKTSNFLGITILKGYETGGTIFNWLVQGGAYTAESSSRMDGAALTTPQSQAAAQSAIAQYQTDRSQEMSTYDKVASLSNPDSLAFKGATALSSLQSDPGSAIFGNISRLWTNTIGNVANIFSGHSLAAAINGYSASNFANIQTYDYPQQCYDLDPIQEHPLDGTNAVQVLEQAGISISSDQMDKLNSWDVESDSNTFYDTIYSIIPDSVSNPDDIAEHIYNCNLLDTVTRGSLGYIYGYTKGNGL